MSDDLGLPMTVTSEDDVIYDIASVSSDPFRLEILYGRFINSKETLSPTGKLQTPSEFGVSFFKEDSVFLSVFENDKEIGLFCLTEIVLGFSLVFDFIFWDRKTTGRQRLILSVMKWAYKQFMVARFEFRVHALAFRQLHRVYKLGAFYEGTKRNAWRYEDIKVDLHILSILSNELRSADTFVHRTRAEKRWYGKITKTGGTKNDNKKTQDY